jgi:arabinose-5-phosphate isomerase
MNSDDIIKAGLRTVELEGNAIRDLMAKIDIKFSQACNLLFKIHGRIAVLGIGKSGHIARKISATLASTGSPSFFIHPGEANHGDIGMITKDDAVLLLSNSGETEEIISLLPLLKSLNLTVIAITGNENSTLAKFAQVNLDITVKQEACPLDLAPTASTTAQLVMGDALAMALLQARGFTESDFALSHPGGLLGKKLLLRVENIMRTTNNVPIVMSNTTIKDALLEITSKGIGITAVADENNMLLGVFTDGDLRRTLDSKVDINTCCIANVMTTDAITVFADILAIEAIKIMKQNKINSLICLNINKQIVGAIHMHDLLQSGIC